MATNTNSTGDLNPLMNVLYSLSLYSPLIVIISILVFSMFTASMGKAGVYLLWIFVITFLRIVVLKLVSMSTKTPLATNVPQICTTGLTQIFIPNDVTYSTYLLSFTMFYFLMPQILMSSQAKTDIVNYYVLSFFVAYIVLDLFIKRSLSCVPSILTVGTFSDIVSGMGLGAIIAGSIMYGTSLRNMLFMNEVNSNKEVCSMPSKQQFRCAVYKNGELVGSSVQ